MVLSNFVKSLVVKSPIFKNQNKNSNYSFYGSIVLLTSTFAHLSEHATSNDSLSEAPSHQHKGSFLLNASIDQNSDAAEILHREKSKLSKNAQIGYELIKQREKQLGPNVSVFYKQDGGVVVVKAKGAFMEDVEGNKYLDCANNVACVGHSHPAVVEAAVCIGFLITFANVTVNTIRILDVS
jgi:hypothetical protein